MKEQLLAAFSDEERQAAAAVGESSDLNAQEKILELFNILPDPLLTTEDMGELLGVVSASEIDEATRKLSEDGALESSSVTQRPFDPEGVVLYRLADVPFDRLQITALQAKLPSGLSRFQFTCDGRIIRSIARIDRLDSIAGTGEQRDEIKTHVKKIAQGIRGGTEIPNSILIVMLNETTVEIGEESADEGYPQSWIVIRPQTEYISTAVPASTSGLDAQQVRLVEIEFPFRRAAFDDEKSILLVDGQQRTAALALVPIDEVPNYDLSVNAVVADEEEAQQVFRVANSTVRISTDFSRALIASMGDEAPGYLREDRVRAAACRQLALTDQESPFFSLVRYPGAKFDTPPVIVYNSLFNVVSTFEQGNLLPDDRTDDAHLLADFVKRAFATVKKTWPTAWGQKPIVSKLMHGAGLRAMATLLSTELQFMQRAGKNLETDDPWEFLEQELENLRNYVVWTEEEALQATQTAKKFYETQVRDRQNTNQDVQKLQKELARQMKAANPGAPLFSST